MKTGAVILCGGRSTRMGRDKATLPFGSEAMLSRVVRLVAEVVDPVNIVVVASRGQLLPPLPAHVTVAIDDAPERGPLEGMAAGFRIANPETAAFYVTSCDVPRLVPAFITRMFSQLGDFDIAVPRDDEHFHPLAAVYRKSVLPQIQNLMKHNQLRTQRLFSETRTRIVTMNELRDIDPDLATLDNVNDPAAYLTALSKAGLAPQRNQTEAR